MLTQTENQKLIKKVGFFAHDLKTDKQQAVFEGIYKKSNGNWSAVKAELAGEKAFTPELINSLEFTHRLSEWSKDNKNFISVFQKDYKINSMRDIALKLNKTEFIEKIKDCAPSKSKEGKNSFAQEHYRELFRMEPTAMLVNMIRDPKVPILNHAVGSNVAEVLEKHPDFNIKTQSVYSVINNAEAFKDIPTENHEAVVTQLKTLQRITALSPDTDAVPILYNAKLHSAMQISNIPQKQFFEVMNESGLDDSVLMQIHSNAQQACVRSEHAIMALQEVGKGSGVAMIDKSMGYMEEMSQVIIERLDRNNLSWDLLFGDADFCEGDEASSVYSASAYYVELLQYLRSNRLISNDKKLLEINDNPKDISGTPLEKLFDRRPDLGFLELTAKNTNTILPYIDLVNEVMENYVAYKHLKIFNLKDETSEELLAEPQNTEYQAYCTLKDEVYPFTLPYHQPIDAERIYLEHLDTSRHELIKTFKKYDQDRDEAVNRAADAEFLGLTREEYVILTKECFESMELMNKLQHKPCTNEEYRKMIGVKPVCEYYGFKHDKTMLGEQGLTLIKEEFLCRTGIDYVNLVDLLKTGFINPFLPKGKSRSITESLHFSYRFLQKYAEAYGMDKMADDLVQGEKLAQLAPLLKEQIQFLTGKKTFGFTQTKEDGLEISDKDINCWVKQCFKKVGRMIVIETGREYVNGSIMQTSIELERKIGIIEDCKIYYTLDEEKTQIGSIDRDTGKVTLKDDKVPVNLKNSVGLSVISEKGEKGIFMLINDEHYLVFLQQKDSCNIDTARLKHLDGTSLTVDEYDRIHRFIRLWRKLGWSIEETDQAIAGLSVIEYDVKKTQKSFCDDCFKDDCCSPDCDDCEKEIRLLDITPDLIHQLVAVKKLLDKTGLELIKLLSFWSNISTSGEKSLYQRLFLTHNVLGVDKVFKADQKGNYLTTDAKLLEHIPVVMAALNLSADEIHAIMQNEEMENSLSLPNLSILYRYRLLSKVLGLKVSDFIKMLSLFGKNIFKDADRTLEFLDQWDKIDTSVFDFRQLNYIIMDIDDEKKPYAPTEKNTLLMSKTLYDGLNAIDEAHKNLKADESITEPALQKINIQEQATSVLVRTKTSLLFETSITEKIIGILEGTNVFSTNAPKGLDLNLPDTSVIKNKFKYDKTKGAIQITGILTEDEANEYCAIYKKPEWENALKRIMKQQEKLYKEILSGIFADEKTKTDAEKAAIEIIIKSSDVTVPLDKIPDGEADPNTAPVKRVAFMEIFLPYLRQQLSHRFVIETLSNYSGLDSKITDALVSEILKLESCNSPIYNTFENIKESAKPDEANWNGYVIPALDAGFTFIIKNSDSKPSASIDGEVLMFSRQEDPDNEWWSGVKQLQAGKLYKLSVTNTELSNLYWKTPASAVAQIPSSALIPDYASSQCKPALIALKKAAMLVSTFDLSAYEVRFFDVNKKFFENIDFNKLTLIHWLRLEAYSELCNSLQQPKQNILEFWNWIYDIPADPGKAEEKRAELSKKISELTTWKKERIDKLIAGNHFNIDKLEDYRNEKNLLKLQNALVVADKISIDIDLLFDWSVPAAKFGTCRKIADSIKNAIRARYNQTDWEKVVKPLHDRLRNNQKDALIGYLLQQPELIKWNVTDADGLFEYFLIDVQMDACMETSRIKQAISSVQLFIQRCFLGLEEEHNGILPGHLDRDRWEWMQRYRVWEANRKVFLYPENWIESNLRDDKSAFFKELESELLQKDINKNNVTDALKAYLYKLDEVANMEVVGLYIEMELNSRGEQTGDPIKLHVFSRTRNAPYLFYYRYYDMIERNWYPWEKIQVDIPCYDKNYMPFNRITNELYTILKSRLTTEEINFISPLYIQEGSMWYLKTDGLSSIDSARLNTILTRIDYKNIYRCYEVNDNGCYLIPVVWNDRLLIFFPQIMKKTKPNPNTTASGSYYDLGKDPNSIENSKPIEYYEIKMAWSEYRNGKWVQKQVSTDAVYSDEIDYINDIQFFKFVPVVYLDKIVIDVDDNLDDDGGYKGAFEFDGNSLKVIEPLNGTAAISIDCFNKAQNNMYSWQISSSNIAVRQNQEIYFYEENSKEMIMGLYTVFENKFNYRFTHDGDRNLMGKINLGQLDGFFKENLFMELEDFGQFYQRKNNLTQCFYHELKQPYSLYNWELFFHTPILLADALSKAQHFEEAMKWFHFVFNPIADGNEDNRFWQFLPFRHIDSRYVLDKIFNSLEPGGSDDAIAEWRKNPFMPHVVARRRPVAYMKWVVMKYIDNLLAWGDYLFRQDTIETINQATQLYILAGHILGPRPMMIPKRGKSKPQSYLSLLDKWDAYGNAMSEFELVAPYSNQTTFSCIKDKKEIAFANIYAMTSSLYFSIPNNPKLMGYWDTLADRLYKIRHCLNIEGIFRKLPLFEPPIDPALLVKAAAQGLSIASVLNDLNTPMPNYRFYYLLQKAIELCNELKSLGGAMLSAIEKKDNETIALIRAKHEGVMQNLLMEIKKKQLEEAQKNLESLQQNRKAPEARMKYYLKLSGLDESLVPTDTADFNGIPNDIVTVDGDSGLKLIKFEKEDMDKAGEAADWQTAIGITETIAGVLNVIPTLGGYVTPIGVGATATFGGSNLGAAASAVARGMQTHSNKLTFQSSQSGKKGGFTRALQDRIFQANASGYELKQIDKQITAQQIKLEIANQEITNQQKAIDNANEVEEFIKNKYTNEELYTWMRGSLKALYHQVYNLAYDLAKKAEKTYCFERGISSANFIQAGYFDAGREGLLAGEQLYAGLKQLEAAYQSERGHDYEIAKQISLYQLNPLAIIQLRENGKCEFVLPENLFDMDYAGHYKRRIKSVSVSIPCIAGPYTGINAKLSLLENRFRNTAISGKNYEEDTEKTDDRFSSYNIPINAIAASSAQNDSGMFELNFKDERYLPFEGAGVISRWRLELPTFRQFDYYSISDAIIHLKYTACEGGERLKSAAIKSLSKWYENVEEELNGTGLKVALNMKHDMPDEWHLLKKNGFVNLELDKSRLPYIAQTFDTAIDNVIFIVKSKANPALYSVNIDDNPINLNRIAEGKLCLGNYSDIILGKPFRMSIDSSELNNLEELMLVVKYRFKKVSVN